MTAAFKDIFSYVSLACSRLMTKLDAAYKALMNSAAANNNVVNCVSSPAAEVSSSGAMTRDTASGYISSSAGEEEDDDQQNENDIDSVNVPDGECDLDEDMGKGEYKVDNLGRGASSDRDKGKPSRSHN